MRNKVGDEEERMRIARALGMLAERVRKLNAQRREEVKEKTPIVYFHSGLGWESEEITGTFW